MTDYEALRQDAECEWAARHVHADRHIWAFRDGWAAALRASAPSPAAAQTATVKAHVIWPGERRCLHCGVLWDTLDDPTAECPERRAAQGGGDTVSRDDLRERLLRLQTWLVAHALRRSILPAESPHIVPEAQEQEKAAAVAWYEEMAAAAGEAAAMLAGTPERVPDGDAEQMTVLVEAAWKAGYDEPQPFDKHNPDHWRRCGCALCQLRISAADSEPTNE